MIKNYQEKCVSVVLAVMLIFQLKMASLKNAKKICTGLKNRADINGIASYFALPPKTFCSWLHTMNAGA